MDRQDVKYRAPNCQAGPTKQGAENNSKRFKGLCLPVQIKNNLIEHIIKGHMKRYFVIRSNIVILHIKYVLEYLTADSS